ncbi:MAG: hypothetical protein HYU66_12670 [Armatimonadetes bacterium]|nr:hypothetical protein [Armatimonadota bacterium]
MKRVYLPLLLPLLLTGCLEVNEEIWIGRGGRGRMSLDVTVDEAASVLELVGRKDPVADVRAKLEKAKQQLAQDRNVFNVEARESGEAGQRRFHLAFEFRRAVRLGDSTAGFLQLTTEPAGLGKLKLRQVLAVPKPEGAVEAGFRPAGEGLDELGPLGEVISKAVASGLLGGKSYTVRIHAPKVISSNGASLDGGRAAQWEYPIGELVTADSPVALECELAVPPSAWIALGPGLVAAVLAVVLLLLLRRKRRARQAL